MSHSRNAPQRAYSGLAMLLLLALLLGPLLVAPSQALAAPAVVSGRPHPGPAMHHPGRMIHPFWMTGEVEEVSEDSVKLLLEGRGHDHPMLRQFEWSVTLAVDEDSILFDHDFNQVDLTALEVGAPVVFVPRMVWGTLGVRLLYTGSPDDLADATYFGRATVVDANTLTVESWRNDVTVVVDEDTIWYDDGRRGRPDELYDDTLVRVIGVEEEMPAAEEAAGEETAGGESDAGQAGETVVRAVLITPGMRGF